MSVLAKTTRSITLVSVNENYLFAYYYLQNVQLTTSSPNLLSTYALLYRRHLNSAPS